MSKYEPFDEVKFSDCAPENLCAYNNMTLMVKGVCDIEDGEEPIYGVTTPDENVRFAEIKESWLKDAHEQSITTVSCDTEKDNRKLTVNILGTDYRIVEKPIKGCDGYCDKTTKEIAVAVKEDYCDLGNFEEYRKKVLRHEVIHAYHYESGLAENFENKQYGFSETLVDWFAYQSPKIFKTFEELGIL